MPIRGRQGKRIWETAPNTGCAEAPAGICLGLMRWAGTGEAIASTRVDRNVSETFASPVIEVELDGDAKGTVAIPGRLPKV